MFKHKKDRREKNGDHFLQDQNIEDNRDCKNG